MPPKCAHRPHFIAVRLPVTDHEWWCVWLRTAQRSVPPPRYPSNSCLVFSLSSLEACPAAVYGGHPAPSLSLEAAVSSHLGVLYLVLLLPSHFFLPLLLSWSLSSLIVLFFLTGAQTDQNGVLFFCHHSSQSHPCLSLCHRGVLVPPQ